MNLCAICQKRKPVTTKWLCSQCRDEWGLTYTAFKDWPEWVKALADCEHQMRRAYAAEDRYCAGYVFSEEREAELKAYGEADDNSRGGSN